MEEAIYIATFPSRIDYAKTVAPFHCLSVTSSRMSTKNNDVSYFVPGLGKRRKTQHKINISRSPVILRGTRFMIHFPFRLLPAKEKICKVSEYI